MNLNRNGICLNSVLVKQQNLNQLQVDAILDLHDEKAIIVDKLLFAPILPKSFVQKLVLELEDIEYMTQKLWRFSEDKTKHTWYMELEHCSCDKSMEYFGGQRPINPKCIIHGH